MDLKLTRSALIITILGGLLLLLPGAHLDDFSFSDDEDNLLSKLMLKDEPVEGSGEGEVPVEPEDPPTTTTSTTTTTTTKPHMIFTKPPSVGHLRPTISHPSDNAPYYPTQVCGKRIYCKPNNRGPCNRNEIFTPTHSSKWLSLSRHPTCPATSSSWRQYGCRTSSTAPTTSLAHPSSSGFCRVRHPHKPCYGYPRNYRYCKTTRRCYPCQSSKTLWTDRRALRGHCGVDKMFTAIDGIYGNCKCIKPNYVPCKLNNRCYPVYSRGPCPAKQWVAPSGTCQHSPCPSLADGRHIYWHGNGHYRAGCYKSFTRGPCRPGMYFKIDDYAKGSARCVHTNQQQQHGSDLYSLLMDWPYSSENSFGVPLITNNNYYSNYDQQSDNELFFGRDLL